VLLECEGNLGTALGGERREAEAAHGLVEMRRTKHAVNYERRGSSPAWQPGHQYAIRLSSPCPRDRIFVRQRGHALPHAAIDTVAAGAAGVDRLAHQLGRRLKGAPPIVVGDVAHAAPR